MEQEAEAIKTGEIKDPDRVIEEMDAAGSGATPGGETGADASAPDPGADVDVDESSEATDGSRAGGDRADGDGNGESTEELETESN
jgi:hypothetical protein